MMKWNTMSELPPIGQPLIVTLVCDHGTYKTNELRFPVYYVIRPDKAGYGWEYEGEWLPPDVSAYMPMPEPYVRENEDGYLYDTEISE